MFVLELSKASGICLAATRGERLVAYLICSRYDTIWHVMNVAVDDRLRREGLATALLEHLFAEADAPGEQYTLEVRASNTDAIRLYEGFGFRDAGRRRGYYHDNREDAVIMWRTAEVAANGSDVARRGTRRARVILALETSCDDTCAAVVVARRPDRVQRDLLAGPAARPLRRRGARGGLPPPPGADRRGHGRRAGAGGRDAGRDRARGRDPRPRADRRAAGGRGVGQGAGGRAPAAADPRGPPARPRGGQHPRRRPDRGALPVPGGQRRPHLPGPRGPPGLLRGDRPDAGRRRRRGLRQGRPAAGPGLSRADPSWTGWPGRATRARSTSRARPRATGWTSPSAA